MKLKDILLRENSGGQFLHKSEYGLHDLITFVTGTNIMGVGFVGTVFTGFVFLDAVSVGTVSVDTKLLTASFFLLKLCVNMRLYNVMDYLYGA